MKLKNRVILGFLLLALSLLTACSGPDEHLWLKTPGWSRAAFLGNTTVNDPVPMAVDKDGRLYFVLFNAADEDAKTLTIVAHEENGNPLWTKSLSDINLRLPDSPQIIWEDGSLRIFWLEQDSLYTLSVDQEANPLGDPVLLSADLPVESYSLAVDSSGEHTLWFAGSPREPGIYALSTVDGHGDVLPVDPAGTHIQLRYDQEDNLHATWLNYPLGYGRTQVLYAFYPAGEVLLSASSETIYEFTIAPSDGLNGPILGIDNDTAYLFWTVSVRSGLEAGAVQTSYLHFPIGKAGQNSGEGMIVVPADYSSIFEPMPEESLHAGDRVLLETVVGFRTTELEEFVPNSIQAGELAVIFRSSTQHLWRKTRNQVNVVYFASGQATSYQPLSFTTSLSTSPNLYNDVNGYLYATWLEKIDSASYAVYFASTAPGVQATLNQSSGRELGRIFAQISFGLLVGILLAPVAAGVLILAPLTILFVFSPLRKVGSERVQDIFGFISILLSIVAFWVGKMAIFPGMFGYVPFSAWVPQIPALLGEILRYGVPILTVSLAIFVAWSYTYRQSNKSTLYFILIYAGIDAAITAAIYAVLIYGAI